MEVRYLELVVLGKDIAVNDTNINTFNNWPVPEEGEILRIVYLLLVICPMIWRHCQTLDEANRKKENSYLRFRVPSRLWMS